MVQILWRHNFCEIHLYHAIEFRKLLVAKGLWKHIFSRVTSLNWMLEGGVGATLEGENKAPI